jgi:hypothetical protein
MGLWRCDCGEHRKIQLCLVLGGYRKSCGCKNIAAFKLRLAKRHALCRAVPGSRALRVLLKTYRGNAKRKNLSFTATEQEFFALVGRPCAYCGAPPTNVQRYYDYRINRKYEETVLYSRIDRIDNNLGYTAENCAPCCKICNLAKRAMTREQFLEWIKRVYNYACIGVQ